MSQNCAKHSKCNAASELEELDLRVFTYHQLKRAGIERISQLLDKDVLFFNNLNTFSRRMFREVVERLDEAGLRLKGYSKELYPTIEPCIDCFEQTERQRWDEELAQLEEEDKAEKRERARIRARERRARIKAAKATLSAS